ncbi:hypothetical protein LRHK_2787 [Lacticaseibacillus rhamnosus ATCC 8530]|nr:hypothetical protein LRHK_2787 [Lacticaseibacillus rhamnosus ATCC 8530]
MSSLLIFKKRNESHLGVVKIPSSPIYLHVERVYLPLRNDAATSR